MSIYYIGSISCSGQSLYHHGVKGMKWGKHLFGLWDKYVSGSTANKLRNTYQNRMRYNSGGMTSGYRSGNSRMFELNQRSMERNAGLYSKYNSMYNNSLAGRAQNLAKRLNNSAAMSRAYSKASRLAATAYTKAASALSGTGRSISQFYTDVMAKAKNAISTGAGIVSKYGQAAVNNIKKMGQNVIDNARKFIDSVLDRRRKALTSENKEDEESPSKRNYKIKLMDKKNTEDENAAEEEKDKKKKKKKTSSKSGSKSSSSKTSSSKSSSSKNSTSKKKEENRKLKKVYRSAGKMDLSPAGTPGISKYLTNLQNLRK